MQEAGASVPAMYELQPQDADLFQDAIQASKDKNKFGAAVTVYPESEYAKMRLFIAEDGKAGFALKGNDIVSVFSEAPHVGASASMLQLAVQEGGRKLDAFDTVLPDLYFNAGFKIVSRTEFNEEFQPDGWDKKAFKDFNEGKPDVVFMVYDPNNTEVPSATAGRLYEDYDEAVKAQDEAVSDYKFPVKFKTEDKIYKPLEKQNAKEQAGPRYSLRPTEPSVRPSTGGGRGITLGERQEGAGTFSGIHYGKAKTERLSGGMFGSGIRGEESKRLAQSRDPRIKRRVYFYIPNDVGFVMRPEAGLGQHVYTQTFDNILPSGDEMSRLYRSVDKDFNAFESAVVDAGYDGYAVPSQGMMVILNHNVPVKYEGLAHELRAEGKLVNNKVKYSLRANLPASVNASVDATTTARDEKGFVERLLSAFNPETRAKLRAGFIFQFEAFERGTKARAARLGDQEYLADVSATAAALQSMQAKNIVEQAMRRGVPVYRNGFTTTDDRFKGLMEIFAPLGKTGDPEIWRYFQFYAAAKRGYRMKQEGRENLFKFDPATRDDLAEAQTLAATARAGGVDFDAVYREYQDWNEALVKFMKDTGVLSDADAAYYTKYGDYIPFYRQIDGEETIGPKIFSSFAGVQKPKAAKGGTAKLGDFLENVIRNASAAVESGMKNVAANRGIRDAVDSGTATQVNIASKDTVTVLEKGVKKFYELDDPLLFEAFKGLNVPRMPWLQILAKPADVLRNFVTKDPGFALANIMRDSVSAWVTSGSDMKPLVDSFKQAAKILANKSPRRLLLLKLGWVAMSLKAT